MKIESVVFFDAFDNPVSVPYPSALYDVDDNLHGLATIINGVFPQLNAVSAIAWLNVGTRYMLIRQKDYTVVYHGRFANPI